MLDKDKIIIVVYVGVHDMSYQIQAIENVRKALSNYFDESVKLIFAPDYGNIGTTFECINPVLLNEEEYKKVQEKLDTIDKVIKELEKNIDYGEK